MRHIEKQSEWQKQTLLLDKLGVAHKKHIAAIVTHAATLLFVSISYLHTKTCKPSLTIPKFPFEKHNSC